MKIFKKNIYQIVDSEGKVYFESKYYVTATSNLSNIKKEYFRSDLKIVKIIK